MIGNVRHWLTPPQFPGDDIKTRRARLLNAASLASIAYLAVLLASEVLSGKTPGLILGLNVIGFVLGPVLINWTRRGHVQAVSVVTITAGWVAVTIAAAALGTVRTPTTALYTLCIIVAGLLVGWRGVAVTAIVSSLAVAGLIWAENAGVLPRPEYAVTVTQWITYTGLFGIAGGLSLLGLQSTRDALARADQEIAERRRAEEALRIQHDLSLALGSSDDPQQALAQILDTALRLESIDCGGVYLIDQSGALDLVAHRGLSPQFIEQTTHYPADAPQARLAREGQAHYGSYQSIHTPSDAARAQEGLRALAVIPVTHQGQLLAVLNLASHTHVDVPVNTCRALETLAQQIGSTLMRLRADAALRESRQNLQTLFDSIDDFLFVLDGTGHILQFNAVTRNRLGYATEELVNRDVLMVHPPDRRAEAAAIIADMLAGQRDFCPVPLQAKDGTLIPVETRVTPGTWSGQPALFGLSRDIGKRQQTEEALRESQSLYHSLVEVSPLSICRKDLAGRFTFANRRFLEASNRSLADLVGKTDFDLHPPELAERYRRDDRAVMDSGQVWELIEPRAIQGDESINESINESIVVQTIKAPVYDGAGKINGVQISFWDITDRQRAEEALRKSHAELQTRNEELDAFAHTVAHDLKNPLSVIMGYAGMLADHGALPTNIVQQALVAISRSGRKAADIVESLLLLASVRKQDVQAAPLDMVHIVDEVVARLADAIQDSGAEVNVPDCASWPVALGHAPWIEEIWVNYLSNALKYGGPQPRIDLGAALLPPLSATGDDQGGGFIRFSVRDYGPGLTLEQQQRLFAPFERLGQARVTGHGLGLSVVRRIADKLGGQVGVDSQPGTLRGSTFYFTLPAAPD